MKQVSAAYKASIAQSLRERSYVRITFENIDPEAASDGSWQPNNQLDYSETETLDYEFNYGPTYATLEHNRWRLNGTQAILPDDHSDADEDGYIGSDLSDENGSYTTPPTLTRQFSSQRTLAGLTITFDSRAGVKPDALTIQYYRSGSLLKTTNVTSIPDTTLSVNDPVENVDRIVISAVSNLPRMRFRIERIIFGIIRTFDNTVLSSSKQNHDIDPLSRRLPKEFFNFVILDYDGTYNPDNPDSTWDFVSEKSPIKIEHGYETTPDNIEWLAPDRYILNSRPAYKNYMAAFTGTGVIESMTGNYYKDTIGTKTLYDMAVAVLEDAGLTPTSEGENPWVIDSSLQSMTTTGVLPITTHMNCLQIIAHAARCRFYTDSENIIHIEPFIIPTGDPVLNIDLKAIMENGQTFSKIDKLKAVEVKKYSYTPAAEASDIYEETTTDTSLHVEFSGVFSDVEVSVSVGFVTSVTAYGRAVDVVLSSSESKTVTIKGIQQTESSSVYRLDIAQDGEIDSEENVLITNDAMCVALANHVAGYLQYRNTYDIIYRGNPELETQDVISLQSKFSEAMRGLVLTDELTFNGSLSGKLKVKVLET